MNVATVDSQLLQLAMNPQRSPEGIRGRELTDEAPIVGRHAWRPVRRRFFQVQERRNPRRCQATTVSGLTMYTADRQPRQARESHAHSIRSADVKRRCGRRARLTTVG
jgi:hypothetical protein